LVLKVKDTSLEPLILSIFEKIAPAYGKAEILELIRVEGGADTYIKLK